MFEFVVHMQVGLKLLIEDPAIFGCHADFHDTIYHSELGASAAILEAGETALN